MSGVERRTFLIGAAVAGAASTGTARAATPPLFEHGVASGDPLPDGVLLWTRVVTSSAIRWEVASDEDFAGEKAKATREAIAAWWAKRPTA